MSGIVNESSGWRAVDDDAAEVARYLETASRLLTVMKRKSIDMLRLSNGVFRFWMLDAVLATTPRRSWPRPVDG